MFRRSISCGYIRHSGRSFLTWTTGDVAKTAFRVTTASTTWSPHWLVGESLLLRSQFSTSSVRHDDANIRIDELSKKEKNIYICKSIYRQMIRWCQIYQQQLYPPDLIQYFTKVPKRYKLEPRLFPTQDFINQRFLQIQQEPRNGKHSIEHPDQHHLATTSSRNRQNDSVDRVFTLLNQIPIMTFNQRNSSHLVISIQSITDVHNCVRALYRLNATQCAPTGTTGNQDIANAYASYQQEIEEYEKLYRNVAFEEMKHMNEISVELQKCQQQRNNRLHHELPSLQKYLDDCAKNNNVDTSHKILPIGQVVQHKKDRWRGVIVHWSYDDGRPANHKRTKVRNDFTSLTLKSYTTPIEEENAGGSDTSSNNNNNQSHSYMSLPERTTNIVYEIAMDDRIDYEEYHDGGDSESSSSSLMKRHLLPVYDTFIPTFITIRQPLVIDENPNIDAGMASSPSSILDVVVDQHLSRISNPLLRQLFTKFDSRTNTYVPKSYMSYTFPNWYPTSNLRSNDRNDAIVTTNPNPNDSDNIRKSEDNNDELVNQKSTKIMPDMIEKIQSFALHLVSVIDNAIGASNQPLSSSPENNHHKDDNQLMDVIITLRNDIQGFASLDSATSFLLFQVLPLSRQLSLQLRSVEYVAITVLEAMYKRRRNKALIGMTTTTRPATSESDDILSEPHQPFEPEADPTSKNEPLTPKFHLGQIVRHKKYKFRGVIIGRDSEPIYNVARWDGLRDVPNAKELPFYNVIPDQQDCIEIFGGERPMRYVCEVNLEPCPSDQMYLDVDVDVGWMKLPDGSYRPPPFERFKYGYDSDGCDTSDAINDYNAFEKCLTALEAEINQWHCECARFKLLQPARSSNDDINAAANGKSSSVLQKYAISIHDLLGLLKVTDNVDDATAIRDTIKLLGKAHPNIQLRSQLQYGIDLMLADNCEKARKILRSIVTDDDPTYIDAWNYLANSENFLSLQMDALASSNKALELNRNDFQAYTQLGILHFQQDEYSKAEVYFRKCLDLDPWSIVSSKLSECIDLLNEPEAKQ